MPFRSDHALASSMLVLWVALTPCGCATERAVRVTFELRAPGDALCVLAGDDRQIDFTERYLMAALPDPATLTFVAGSAGRTEGVIGALVLAGGRVTGTGHLTIDLRGAGTLERSMRVANCRDGAPTGLGISPSGTFATLATTSRLYAADFDGDGREELFGITEDGSLAMLEAEDPSAGSRSVTELSTSGGRLVGNGDFDGDCRLDLLVAAGSGLLRVRGVDGASPPPIGPAEVADGAVIEMVRGGGPRLVAASSAGLSLLDPFDGEAEPLDALAASFVVAADVDGDGIGDLLAGGAEAPTRLYLGGESVPRQEPGAGSGLLAAATGPGVAGDFDGDGLDDLALVDATAIRVLGYGEGALSALPFTATFTAITRIAAGDVDGDCTADLLVLDGETVRFFHGSETGLEERAGPALTALDLVIADVDGDGAREVALLGAGRRVSTWRP